MDEKKKSGIAPQEKIEELSDDELSQISGGTTSYVGGIVRQNLTSCMPNINNIANSTDVTVQKKHAIDGIASTVYAAAPTWTDEP